jgi:AraC-like DNA-binding protein
MSYSSASDLVRGMKARLAACGFDVDDLFQRTGLDRDTNLDSDPTALSDKLSHLWETLTQMSDDPLIAFRVSSPYQLGWLGLMGHIMLLSPDIKTAIENLVRYTPLLTPTVQSSIDHLPQHMRVTLKLPAGTRPVPRQRYDFVWSMVLRTLCSAAACDGLKPTLITYAFPKPREAQAIAEAFGCPVRFDAPANAIEFANADLYTSFPTAPPMAADWTLRMFAESALTQRATMSFSARVQRILTGMLAKGEPLREDVAKHLMISERTLQRRLSEEGTNFTRIVDDTRRAMAQQYLTNGQISLKKLSFQLGFSEPSAFHRACKRWFGRSPKQLQRAPHVQMSAPPRIAPEHAMPPMPSEDRELYAVWPG